MQPTEPYLDFMGLGERRFDEARLVVFTGASGSGKSTAMEFLLENHPDFVDRDHERVFRRPLELRQRYDSKLVVIDEIAEWRHLAAVARLLANGHTLIVASHLPERALKIALSPWRGVYFRTDDDPSKIHQYLGRLGVSASDAAVERFCSTYGATFTDIDIILEHFEGTDFDRSLWRFERYCTVTLEPNLARD